MHTYSLIFTEDERGVAQRLEFEADNPKDALRILSETAAHRVIELRQDGRKLATVVRMGEAFWAIS